MSTGEIAGADTAPDPEIQSKLSIALGKQYTVRRLLGRGGFAEVFEVWDASLERRLAVKVLRPDIAWTSGMLARFQQEARAVARLTHPNILPIHFVGEGEGLVYYAMPFIDGQSLGDLLRNGAMEVDRALNLIRSIVQALGQAHEQGLIHRDIKPDNVMVEQGTGRALLVDFGIAKRLDAGKGQTQTGFVVGTPQYMSPEQALGQSDLDQRSDLYAVGAMLFQMVTGSPPFEGDTSQEIVVKHITEPPPLPSTVNARIPRWLSEVIIKCLEKRPVDRYQSAAELLEALGQAPASAPVESVSAQRVVRKLKEDDRTEMIVSAQQRAARVAAPAEVAIGPTMMTSPAPSNGRSGRLDGLWLGLVALALVASGAAGFLWFRGATIEVENRLVEPVAVAIAGKPEQTLAPGATVSERAKRGQTYSARWRLIAPRMSNGTAMGVEMTGQVDGSPAKGRAHHVINSRTASTAYFAPLITNATNQPLQVWVNSGIQGAMPCGCTVPPGATRARIGYYALFRNSSVRVEARSGRGASFTDFSAQVDPVSGAVGLRFEERDLK